MKNRRGPKTDSCGAPNLRHTVFEFSLPRQWCKKNGIVLKKEDIIFIFKIKCVYLNYMIWIL